MDSELERQVSSTDHSVPDEGSSNAQGNVHDQEEGSKAQFPRTPSKQASQIRPSLSHLTGKTLSSELGLVPQYNGEVTDSEESIIPTAEKPSSPSLPKETVARSAGALSTEDEREGQPTNTLGTVKGIPGDNSPFAAAAKKSSPNPLTTTSPQSRLGGDSVDPLPGSENLMDVDEDPPKELEVAISGNPGGTLSNLDRSMNPSERSSMLERSEDRPEPAYTRSDSCMDIDLQPNDGQVLESPRVGTNSLLQEFTNPAGVPLCLHHLGLESAPPSAQIEPPKDVNEEQSGISGKADRQSTVSMDLEKCQDSQCPPPQSLNSATEKEAASPIPSSAVPIAINGGDTSSDTPIHPGQMESSGPDGEPSPLTPNSPESPVSASCLAGSRGRKVSLASWPDDLCSFLMELKTLRAMEESDSVEKAYSFGLKIVAFSVVAEQQSSCIWSILACHIDDQFKEFVESGFDTDGSAGFMEQLNSSVEMSEENAALVLKGKKGKKKATDPSELVPTRLSSRVSKPPVPVSVLVQVEEKSTASRKRSTSRKKKIPPKKVVKSKQRIVDSDENDEDVDNNNEEEEEEDEEDDTDEEEIFPLLPAYGLYTGPAGPKRVYEQIVAGDPVYDKPFWKPDEADAPVSNKSSCQERVVIFLHRYGRGIK